MSEEIMQSEGVEAPESSEVISEPTADVTQEVTEESATSNEVTPQDDGEINSNPENAKIRVDKKSRKVQRQMEEMRSEIESLKSQNPQTHPDQPRQPQGDFNQPTSVVDPITGEYMTPGTGRYDAVLLQQQQQQLAQNRSAHQQQEEAKYYQKQQDEKFFDALDDASDRYEDFDDVVRNDNLPLTEAMLNVAKVTPNGADLLYYLAKNPKEVQRISGLHPLMQQQEVARHAIQFASKNNVSKAPAPVQPVGETSGGKSSSSFSRVAQSPSELKSYFKDKERRGKR